VADDADIAGDRIEIETKRYLDAIDRAIKAQAKQLPAIGVCYYCDGEAPPGRSFCSKLCSDDYEHERQRKKDLGL